MADKSAIPAELAEKQSGGGKGAHAQSSPLHGGADFGIALAIGALRTAGRSSSSPIAMEMSYLSCSKPNEPAMPQQPGAGAWKSMPMRRSSDSSADIFMMDL